MSLRPDISPAKGVLPPGAALNDIYAIDEFINAGGMGEIYRGHEILTGSPVAIKLIRDELSTDAMALALFRNEASALGRLHHEAIVRYFLFSLDPALKRHYLAMEFVEGESLQDRLRRGPLPLDDALALMRRVASGLHAAHMQNVVHRDVTPDNIIVPAAGIANARIIDFGIARSTRSTDQTVIGGGVAGKYKYMSAEQLGMFGGDVRAASDIYSFGLVLVQCLTGAPLDMGGSEYEMIEKRRRLPDLSRVPPQILPLLTRMLQPDPAHRPGSMAEVAAWAPRPLAVAAEPEPETIFARPPSGKTNNAHVPANAPSPPAQQVAAPRSRWVKIAASAAAASLVGGGLWFALRPGNEAPLAPTDARPAATAQTTTPDPAALAKGFIYNFDGGDCFLATPRVVSAASAEIDGFGRGKERFDALDAAFKKAMGYEARIDMREVTAAQCPALDVARRFLSHADAPRIDLAKTHLRWSGDDLRGGLDAPSHHVGLYIVDERGLVHDVTSQLGPMAEGRRFALRLQPQRPEARPQAPPPLLLLAVAADEPIPTASGAQTIIEFAERVTTLASSSSFRPSIALAYLARE
jgi:hypothetical protein